MTSNPETETDHVPSSHGRTFAMVFLGLCFLTAVSVLLAMVKVFPTQTGNWIAFMGVAMLKAALVIGYFMHLRWEQFWKYYLTVPAVILGIALTVSLIPDIGFRGKYYSNDRWENVPENLGVAAGDAE